MDKTLFEEPVGSVNLKVAKATRCTL